MMNSLTRPASDVTWWHLFDEVLSLCVSHEHCLSLQLDVDPVLLPDDLLQLLPLLPLQLLGDPEMLELRLSRPLTRR